MWKKQLMTALLLAVTLPTATIAAEKYYWVDGSGNVVRDGSGNCVVALYHGASSAECEGKAPAPAPAPVAPPVAAPLDSDGDGISDAMDSCPNTPSAASVDRQGCPLDSDKDGVANYMDRCPGTPKGATVDPQGCAEKIVVQNLNFPSNSSALTPASRATLDEVANSIMANPAVKRVSVSGYTDDRGAADYNKQLSERRAKSVADYLVSRGLNADMVSSTGMGEANPVASNDTAEGRRANRRVEIDLK